MNRERTESDIRSLEAELRRITFRYKLAVKDGAVTSIINDIRKSISDLEKELVKRKVNRHTTAK